MLRSLTGLRWIRITVVVAVLLAAAFFAGREFVGGMRDLDQLSSGADAALLAAALLLCCLGTLCLAAAWIVLLGDLSPGVPPRRVQLAVAFSYAWIARYVPGTIPFFAGKVYLGTRAGYGRRPLIAATAVQNMIEILVAGVLGSIMVVGSLGVAAGNGLYLALAIPPAAGLLALHPRVLRRLADLAMRLLRRDPLPDGMLPSARIVSVAAACVAMNQFVNGIALWLLLYALAGAGPRDAMLATGGLSLAGAAGLLVVMLPAGLGVRDGALTAVLAARIAAETAAIAAIVMRALTVVADLALFVLALAADTFAGWRLAVSVLRDRDDTPVPSTLPAATAGRRVA